MLDFQEQSLKGLKLIYPKIFTSEMGFFLETWQQEKYQKMGIGEKFVQDNLSYSKKNVVRGMHFQTPSEQGKLVYSISGTVWDVVVDIRPNSPTFGKWLGFELSSENKRQLYIPPGFAHGFCVLSEESIFSYKCTDFYMPSYEYVILWDDPDLNITWPISSALLSDRDKAGISFKEFISQIENNR